MSVVADVVLDALDERTRDLLAERSNTRSIKRRGWVVRRALLVADIVGLTCSFALADSIFRDGAGRLSSAYEVVAFVVSLPLWVIGARIYGLYDDDEKRADHSTADDFARVFHLVTACTFLLYAAANSTHWFHPQFAKLLTFWFLGVLIVPTFRALARAYARTRIEYLQNTIILGAGVVGQTVARKLLKHPEYGLNLVGFVDADPCEPVAGLEHLVLLGSPNDLPALVRMLDVERVIVAFSNDRHDEQLELIRELNALDVQVDIVPRLFEVLYSKVRMHSVEGVPVCSLPPVRLSLAARSTKRAVDIAGALLGILVLGPVLAAISIAIKCDSSGPIFFRQRRVGERKRHFSILSSARWSAMPRRSRAG